MSVLSDKVRVVVNNIIIELSHTPVRWEKKCDLQAIWAFDSLFYVHSLQHFS